jgi:hypothetical protein
VMAHEIGHLLLGRNSHSVSGIMRGTWGSAELRAIAQGALRFTRGERKRLVTMTALRTGTIIAGRR